MDQSSSTPLGNRRPSSFAQLSHRTSIPSGPPPTTGGTRTGFIPVPRQTSAFSSLINPIGQPTSATSNATGNSFRPFSYGNLSPFHAPSQSPHSRHHHASTAQPPSSVPIGFGGAPPLSARRVSGPASAAGSSTVRSWTGNDSSSISEWSFFGIDLTINNIAHIYEDTESSNGDLASGQSASGFSRSASANGSREICSASFGADRWKIELVQSPRIGQSNSTSGSSATTPPTSPANMAHPLAQNNEIKNLSLYLTCHLLDLEFPRYSELSVPVVIMIGIREPRQQAGAKWNRDGWVWREWETEFSFARENEVFECHALPSLADLLRNERIKNLDSFTLSIQIQSPGETIVPQLPGYHHVPQDLLSGVESLLDDPTGDVRIFVHERQENSPLPMHSSQTSTHSSPRAQDIGLPSMSSVGFAPGQPLYRKRVLFAHSALLRSRSSYFDAMLSNNWSEGAAVGGSPTGLENGQADLSAMEKSDVRVGPNGRNVYTVTIEDFDFETVYWLLRWIYSSEIEWPAAEEDVRTLPVDDLPPGWLSNSLSWDWHSVPSSDASSSHHPATSSEVSEGDLSHHHSAGGSRKPSTASSRASNRASFPPPAGSASHHPRSHSTHSATGLSRGSGGGGTGGTKRQQSFSAFGATLPSSFSSSANSTGSPSATSSSSVTAAAGKRSSSPTQTPSANSLGKRTANRTASLELGITSDPHPHPCAVPPPASAFSIYRLAHRYQINSLAHLALTHIVGTLTPRTSFPLLLATPLWPELHSAIKSYALENYYAVIAEPEFSRCYAEVGEGLWNQGGEVLLDFTLNLGPANQ